LRQRLARREQHPVPHESEIGRGPAEVRRDRRRRPAAPMRASVKSPGAMRS
jgi:hypothetical protein